ncbi:hypothetical protein SAMN04488570_2062 [Nocardioides scoriae]|uniref:SurA N-terminal domain-containing protein n=1 Tax=Nocardioides scoriae TaxID=642780 RepID=A0A1H1SVX8_9ACTN|nr:hypothetical protein [Nocardioides scoriae]SDS51973.1 hypothetical protein SAMN04488570_2062 [Nocardioides scoriae]
MKARRWAPVLGAGVLLLSGCSQLTPGTASVVDGSRIPTSQVDDLAAAQCSAIEQAGQSGQSSEVPLSSVKRQSLALLVDIQLDERFAADQGVSAPRSLVTFIDQQLQTQVQGVKGRAGTVLSDVLSQYAASRADVVQVAAEATGQKASPTNLDALLTEGLKQRDAWAKKVEIDTDARFNPGKDGRPGGGSGSVSQAGSDFAKQAGAEQADPAFVASLPDSQKCG